MTKEKIIKLCEKYINNKNGFMATSFADELLKLINRELSERLEKLHTEMDERMREEVAIEKRMGEKKAENAKKEVARKILDHITEIARDKGIKLPIEMLDAFNV